MAFHSCFPGLFGLVRSLLLRCFTTGLVRTGFLSVRRRHGPARPLLELAVGKSHHPGNHHRSEINAKTTGRGVGDLLAQELRGPDGKIGRRKEVFRSNEP
jgi:hypothetical protein